MKPALTQEFVSYMTDKKRNSRYMYNLLCAIDRRKEAEKLLGCCDEMTLGEDGKFFRTFFCENRFCPMCTWKRCREYYCQIKRLVERMHKYYGFLFCTLTVRNCSGSELDRVITSLLRACNGFVSGLGSSPAPKAFKGAIRALEVTYNAKSDTYHPHLHLMICVPKVYFNREKNSGLWITADEAFARWRRYIGEELVDPEIVSRGGFDFRCVKGRVDKDGCISYNGAIAEIAKYTFKEIPLIKMYVKDYERTVKVFRTLHDALFRRQTLRYMGVFAEFAAEDTITAENTNFIQSREEEEFSRKHTFRYDLTSRYIYSYSIRVANQECLLPLNIPYVDFQFISDFYKDKGG